MKTKVGSVEAANASRSLESSGVSRSPDNAVTSRPERLFESVVGQYARYRTSYPSREVDRLADLVGLEHNNTVIDVGCGTGQLAIPLARHAGEVIAIDPVPDMLAVGRQNALAAELTNITWILGDSSKLASLVGPGAHVATFAASFHWTDRAEVARVLDTLLDDKGSIVIVNDDLDDDEQPPWVHVVTDLRSRYLGNAHTAATAAYTDPPVSHREILASSPFAAVETLTWSWERRLTIDEAVGLQFTYSFSTPAMFGHRAHEFAVDARDAILALHPDGYVTEPFRVEVLVATRP
jgi:SAM-dependent methyltransferase